jgi:hypothetical protein
MREDINEALKAVAEKHGCTISAGSASYSDLSFNLKLEVVENSTDGSVVTKAMIDWNENAKFLGLDESLLGKTVMIQGKTLEIVGLKPRASKYPVLGKDARDGNTYKLPVDLVINASVVSG